jgi:hypothetical protein
MPVSVTSALHVLVVLVSVNTSVPLVAVAVVRESLRTYGAGNATPLTCTSR